MYMLHMCMCMHMCMHMCLHMCMWTGNNGYGGVPCRTVAVVVTITGITNL